MGVLHTPSRHTFECDGSQRVFPIPSLMISQDFVRIEINGVLQSDRKQWDIVNNSLVFVLAPINGAILDVQVASDSESLGELGMISNVDILAQNIVNVNEVANINLDVTKVADIDLDVTTVAGIVLEIPIVSAISTDVTTVASINSDVTTVANIYTDVTKVSNIDTKVTTVADNILDIQNADENALITKEEAWKAEAARLTAKSYATEPENDYVKIYTSNNDGTFTITDTIDYSSYHWEKKASTLVTTGIIVDVTSSTDRTYSSNKIDGIVNTINNNITTIVTDNITPIENSIDIIDNTTVKLTGNQTIGDIKIFTSSPIVPTPTANTEAANKKYVDTLIPTGVILLWSGSIASIPAGWALCNGANGTPDLRNRFVIGSSVDVSGVSNTSVTGANTKSGGSKDAIVVSHTHTGSTNSTGAHTHNADQVTSGVLFMGTTVSNITHAVKETSSSGAHSHTLSIASTGSSETNANLPPYFALAYIMKL